ncbi:hypothetical protein Aperf_G00000098346 [Anoplocephala perfoliata]
MNAWNEPNHRHLLFGKLFDGEFAVHNHHHLSSLTSPLPLFIFDVCVLATSPESVQTSADNGNAYAIDIAGSGESASKRIKTEASQKSGQAPPTAQKSPSGAGKGKTTSKKFGSSSNRAGNRSQSSTSQQNRDQRFDGSQRQHSASDVHRRMNSTFRHSYQGMLNSSSGSGSTGLLSPRTGINCSLQQQTADSFLQQASIMALLPQRQQIGSSRGPHQPGLIGSGPTQSQHNQQQQQHQQQVWSSIMGGPPRPYGGCRNCGSYNSPGMTFCNNCRAPLR